MATKVAKSPTAIWAAIAERDPNITVNIGCQEALHVLQEGRGKAAFADGSAATKGIGSSTVATARDCTTDSSLLQAGC